MSDERRAMASFCDRFDLDWCETPKNTIADCDGIIVADGVVEAVVEVKCRYDVDFDGFFERYNGEWLVTESKLERCQNIAKGLGVDFIGFLYISQSDKLLWKTINSWRSEKTATRASINNPMMVEKVNGFIDLRGAKCLSL